MEDLYSLLDSTSHWNRDALKTITGASFSTPKSLISEIRRLNCVAGEHALRELFGSEESYREILKDVCKRMDISHYGSAPALESRVVTNVANTIHVHGGSDVYDWAKVGGVAAALLVGRAGGFTTYMLASSTLKLVLGPLGWGALALYGIYTLSGGVEDDKLIPAILCIAAIRNEPAVQTQPAVVFPLFFATQ